MTDHITRLKEALEPYAHLSDTSIHCSISVVTARELLERLEQAEKDVKRLDSGCIMTHERDEFGDEYQCERRGLDLRKAIDAAIASQAAPPADGGGQNGGKAASSAAKCLSGNDSSVVDGGGQDG